MFLCIQRKFSRVFQGNNNECSAPVQLIATQMGFSHKSNIVNQSQHSIQVNLANHQYEQTDDIIGTAILKLLIQHCCPSDITGGCGLECRTMSTNWTAFHWLCWVNRFKHDFMKQAFHFIAKKKNLKNCLLKRWKPSRLTAMPRALRMFILHIGHVRWSSSHGSTQLLWNKCLQRNERNKSTQNH